MREFVDGGILELVRAVEDSLKGSIKRHEIVTRDMSATSTSTSVSTDRFLTSKGHNMDPEMMIYRESLALEAVVQCGI